MIKHIGLRAAAAATGICALSAAAFAADMPVKAPPRSAAAAVFSWTGFYAGIHGGYGWGKADHAFPFTNLASPLFPFAGGTVRTNLSGGLFGGHVGYNQQVGNIVVGLEASGGWSGLKGSRTNPLPVIGGIPIYTTELEWYATLTPRLGYAGTNWLLYAKGGLAAGRVDSILANPTAGGPPQPFRESNDHIGWTVGAGLEYAWTPNWIVGLEYNHVDLGTEHYGGINPGIFFSRGDYELRLRYSSVLARLSYRADARVEAASMATKAPAAYVSSGPWTGFYTGAHGGYGWGDADYAFPLNGAFGFFAPTDGGVFGQSISGGVFGGHLGANYQIGHWVVGLEGSLAWSGIRKSSRDVFAAGINTGTEIYATKLNWLATVTPRVGYANNNWLYYAKAGLAGGRVDSRIDVFSFQTGSFQEKTDHLGWTAGGGVEYAWTPNWIVGVEYNYVDLGHEKYGGRMVLDGNLTVGPEYTVKLNFSTVLARLSYKFGPAPVVARY